MKNMVESTLNGHGFDVEYVNKPYFVSLYLHIVLQTELPRGYKIPIITIKTF